MAVDEPQACDRYALPLVNVSRNCVGMECGLWEFALRHCAIALRTNRASSCGFTLVVQTSKKC